MKKIVPIFATLLFLSPVLALAQVGVTTSADVNATVGATGASASVSATVTTRMKNAMSRADKEIARRTTALTDLAARISDMQRVSADFKQTMTTNVQNQIAALAQLKTKIDADTDATTLKTDLQSITQSYRIFALVLPQTRIAAAADREETIISMMSTLGAKLQARVTAAQNANQNVTALLAALTDMSSKIKDADTQAQAAVTVTAQLTPDNGDQTKMASNTAALKTGRTDIQTGQQDLVAARKDVDTITKGLKTLGASANASASTTSTTSGQ